MILTAVIKKLRHRKRLITTPAWRLYSYDRLFFALYGYDGGTTRTYKYSMDLSPNWVNGRLEAVNFNMHTAMFYPNSYLNFNQDGYYTKHYYNGMERIASRLGDQHPRQPAKRGTLPLWRGRQPAAVQLRQAPAPTKRFLQKIECALG